MVPLAARARTGLSGLIGRFFIKWRPVTVDKIETMHDESFVTLCYAMGLTPEQFCRLTGVSLRTFYRYQHQAPPWVSLLLHLLNGDLGKINGAWHSWTLTPRGELISPFGEPFSPGEVLSIYWRKEHTASLKMRIRKLEQRLAETEQKLNEQTFLLTPANDTG